MTICSGMDALKYFFPRTVIDWNNLDGDIVSAPTVHSFKERLRDQLITAHSSAGVFVLKLKSRKKVKGSWLPDVHLESYH